MKRFLICLMIISLAFASFAEDEKKEWTVDQHDYDSIVKSIPNVCPPFETNGFIVFTAEKNSRSYGIAFDYENYSKIHKFKVYTTTSLEGEVTKQLRFFIMKKPPKITEIKYRIIIDGLWTTDYTNENVVYDEQSGIPFSYLALTTKDPVITETESNGYTKFVCFAESGKKIRLGGTFTDWDSWIYEMKEVAYGKYELSLPLPKGTYYYNFYEGMHSFQDSTNPLKGYTADGKTASCIIIN